MTFVALYSVLPGAMDGIKAFVAACVCFTSSPTLPGWPVATSFASPAASPTAGATFRTCRAPFTAVWPGLVSTQLVALYSVLPGVMYGTRAFVVAVWVCLMSWPNLLGSLATSFAKPTAAPRGARGDGAVLG